MKCPRAAFTMVEAVVAAFIIALFVAGAFGVMQAVREAMDRARDRYTAVNLAKNRVERLRLYQVSQLPSLKESAVQLNARGVSDSSGNFRRTTDAVQRALNLWEVTVTVEILNRASGQFDGSELEVVRTYLTDFTPPPQG